MNVKYDGHVVTLGNLISAGTAAVLIIASFVTMQAQIGFLGRELVRVSEESRSELASLRSDAASREARIRALEITAASTASDLRAIQQSLSRIEHLLEEQP